jgi:cardiolipin synthase
LDKVSVYFLIFMHLAPASYSVYHILLYKRDTRSALGWIIACIFIPFGGPTAYFLFGINRVRSRAQNLKRHLFEIGYEVGLKKSIPKGRYDKGIRAVGYHITGTELSLANTIEIFHNGEQTYPAMLDSIKQAKNRILLTTYILKTDKTGKAFIDALSEAVGRGVDVKVLVDGIGELYSWPKASTLLVNNNVTVATFMPPSLFPPNIYLNMRNHRKLLIIDDELAFAGGMNISDDNLALTNKPRKISDIHFSFHGSFINDLSKLFYDDWLLATGKQLTSDVKANASNNGDTSCRVIPDGPGDEMDFLALTIQAVIATASESIEIMTPYFLPSRELISSLQSATLRGIKVRIVLPEKNNLFYMHWANRNILSELLQLNIEIFYQAPPFCHSKLLCIDDQYCMVGSANLDPRSLRLNYEVGIEIFSEKMNALIRAHFDDVISTSTRLNRLELENRPIPIRLRDSLVSLLSPYL